jgi:hypothetical protein
MTLTFILGDRSLEGRGVDEVGAFEIVGVYSRSRDSVQFIKSYRTHEILYEGTWDGHRLRGQWVIQGYSRSWWSALYGYCGSFDLWSDL